MSKRVLVVEDEPAIAEMLVVSLERNGFDAILAQDSSEAKEVLANHTVDIALIDWMLPGTNGIELIRHVRADEVTRSLPIIMLTARGEESDITTGLDAGADDYVSKPFSPQELNSRINALLRRSESLGKEIITHGELVCDCTAHRVTAGSTVLELGHTEFKLLEFLMRHPERVYTRGQLLDHVWGRGKYIEERTVDVHILRLRKLLKPQGMDTLIQTVRGAGYRFSGTA